MCMCVHVYMCACVSVWHVWKSEDRFWELVSSVQVNPRKYTEVVMYGSKSLYPLGRLTSPISLSIAFCLEFVVLPLIMFLRAGLAGRMV